MGVKGLTTYIENSDKNYLRSWAFRDNKLIIDGCNLYFTLYFERLDQTHGGDYDAFEKLITQFFSNLEACDIRPYVVLDGGDDHTDKKWDTLMTRRQEKIKAAYGLSKGEKKEKVLPILIKTVFRQVLKKLKVPLVQCFEEADWEIAALAKQWNCPVLSNDSDFYIFNLRRGFLPITHFQWKKVKVDRRTNENIIQVKHYTVGTFCASFNMKIDILPVFASILGNDYVNLQDIKNLNWEKYSTLGTKNARIDGLLNWLSQFPKPEAAVSALVEMTKDENKAFVKEALLQGLREYKLNAGSLSQFFLSKKISQKAVKGALQVLPKWTLRPLLEAEMGSSIINVLMHQRISLAPQVEDFQLPCSSETSRPIRQVVYGLLLLGKQPAADKRGLAAKSFSGTSKHYVEEYKRQEMKLSCEKVEAIQTEVMKGLHLKTLPEAPRSSRLQVLLDALGASSEMLEEIPEDLQLQMLVTRYWLINAQPQPCQEHLWGLLMGMVYGQLSSPKAEDMLSKLKAQADGRRPVLEGDTAHVYSQWQSCLKWTLTLNRLLCAPLSEPECARLYRGSLVHQVVRELRIGVTLQSLLDDSGAKELFKQPIDELSSYFEDLICEDIDSEDDDLRGKKKKSKDQKPEMPEFFFTVRSRHKAKARNAHHPSKKSERRCYE